MPTAKEFLFVERGYFLFMLIPLGRFKVAYRLIQQQAGGSGCRYVMSESSGCSLEVFVMIICRQVFGLHIQD